MTLDDATRRLEGLPGVYEVNTFVVHNQPDAKPEHVKFCIHIASPVLFPEETRLGILGVQDALERELGCLVSIIVSAGLRIGGKDER